MNIFDWIQCVAGFVLAIFYLPNIKQLWRVKTTKELSLIGWIILLVALCGMLTNSIHLFLTVGAWSYMLSEILNVVFCLVYVIEIIYIRYFYKTENK